MGKGTEAAHGTWLAVDKRRKNFNQNKAFNAVKSRSAAGKGTNDKNGNQFKVLSNLPDLVGAPFTFNAGKHTVTHESDLPNSNTKNRFRKEAGKKLNNEGQGNSG